MAFKKRTAILSLMASATLIACGGGGSGPTGATTPSLSGTAAVGAPLPNADVILKGANGSTLTQKANALGEYKFPDVSSLTAPLMLQAKGTAGGTSYTLHSLLPTAPAAGVNGVLNATPATQAVVAQATGQDPAAVFADTSTTKIKDIDPGKLKDAKDKLMAALADVLKALGQTPASVDLFTTAFAANGAGLDKLLDTIAFQSTATSATEQSMTATNKNTGAGVTIAPTTQVASVTAVTAPTKTDVDLNTASIQALVDAFNANFATLAGIQSPAMADLFDSAYLNSGADKTTQLTRFNNPTNVGITLSSYVLQGCDGESKICKAEMTSKSANGGGNKFNLPVKQGVDGKWRAYGNQIPFEFDFKPTVQANYSGSTNGVPTLIGGTQTNFNFWFTGYIGTATTRTYNSAKLFTSNDNGANWVLSMSLKPNANCTGNNWLPIDNSTNLFECRNVKSVSDADAATNNAARLAGNRKFKIEAYTSANYTGTPKVFEDRVLSDNFTAATGAAAIANSGVGITAADLGTSSVRFFGPVDEVRIEVGMSTGTTTSAAVSITGTTTWDSNQIASLSGVASVAKAYDLCLTNSPANVCTTSYGTGTFVNFIGLASRTTQGQGVFVTYKK